MVIVSKEQVQIEKTILFETEIGFCTNCEYTWCINRGKIIYCSFKYLGIKGFICDNGNCSIE
ncbi:MAG: hypothetical protein EAX90_10225 [Candidatus Heimdallarchaeota archaeon]|nr:hypothetical protein [Candidatus Heimdallarchaeota archaeon]